MLGPEADDPRLRYPCCPDLVPVETLHENPWFAVRKRGDFYSVEYNIPQVVVLPIVEGSRVLVVKQRRPLTGDVTLELPAGGVKPNEVADAAAARELCEETGVEVADLNRFRQLAPLCVTPRYPCLTYIFRVDLTASEFDLRREHDDEIQQVECLTFFDVFRRIVSGDIFLSLPIAILARDVLLPRAKW